ncbi:unnamed protein product [Caenorhabditis angaria]|uniref:DUF19 domain-containing protein n=1 Tax=Caenorhabditis angaria TaxID=860376 RepID=A0A9P1MVI8_9PELO|nr:unnamed protein product [Caenorhabditis angaria]
MRTFVLLAAFFSYILANEEVFKTNRTSCVHYISCLETIQTNFKDCAGGAAISLTLEAKDVNIRDLVKYRALEFVGCQDRIIKEIVDFESLQQLVGEDARECFDKLPESTKHIEPFGDSCDYVQPAVRNTTKGDSLQCLIEYKQDREYCESLLECCPDHTRCGERMNAVSLAYQNARVKADQVVYNMISCIVSNDPRFLREGARLQSLRDPYRNAGLPFLRPDAYTEARITRRLALTTTSILGQRKDRFMKKYSQIRQIVAQRIVEQYAATTTTSTTTEKPVEDLVAEQSTDAEKVMEEDRTLSSEERVERVRSLIRTASDDELSQYVALISDGKFAELFELAAKKNKDKLKVKIEKLKNNETEDEAEEGTTTTEPEVPEKPQKKDKKHNLVQRNVPDELEAKEMTDKDRALLVEKEIKQNSKLEKAETPKKKQTPKEIEIIKKHLENEEDKPIGLKSAEETAASGDEEDVPRLENESGEHQTDVMTQIVKEMSESIQTSTPVTPEQTTTLKTELVEEILTLNNNDKKDEIDEEGSGSGEEHETIINEDEEQVLTTPSTTTTTTTETSEVIENIKKIRPRSERSHCQQYANCWQTVIDYEQQCDRKYSTDVLSHGIDDAEILSILQNSSISHHEIVLKACLKPLDRSVHSTLKQLLVIQRGVRKACLDLGRNKIAVTDAEENLCQIDVPTTESVDEFLSSVHSRSQANHLTCRAKIEPIREACGVVRNCCASVDTCDNYIASSPVKKLETEAVRRLVKRQNDCETKMLQTLTYIHEQLSSPERRRRYYYH